MSAISRRRTRSVRRWQSLFLEKRCNEKGAQEQGESMQSRGWLRGVFRFVAGAGLVIATVGFSLTQVAAQSYRGSIHGIVTDSMGGAIPGASVTATNGANGSTREAKAGEDGSYIIPELSSGAYKIRASAAGFRPEVGDAVVEVGADTILDFKLYPPSVSETVNVTAAAPITETTQDVL